MSTLSHTLAFILTFATLYLQAQVTLSGTAIDAQGLPLVGVNVYLPSTYEGATTDSLGRFSFTASAKTPFAVYTQYVGYRDDSLVVRGDAAQTVLRLKLKETAAALSEIVVTAGAFVASDTRKTAVLSSVDVATTGAQADLAEALSTLPGSTPAGESGQLLVRGGTAAETQAYINGLRVPKLYSANLPDVPSRTRFSPFAFRGITFATGGFSAAYGDALSGALILQTQDLPDRDLTSVSLMTLGGSIGRTQKIGNDQAFAVDLGGTHLGLYAQLNEESRRVLETPPQGLNGSFGYWWNGEGGRNLRVYSQGGTQRFAGNNAVEAPFYGVTRRSLENLNTYTQAVYQQPTESGAGMWEMGAAVATNHDRFTRRRAGHRARPNRPPGPRHLRRSVPGGGAVARRGRAAGPPRGRRSQHPRDDARRRVGPRVRGRFCGSGLVLGQQVGAAHGPPRRRLRRRAHERLAARAALLPLLGQPPDRASRPASTASARPTTPSSRATSA